jgi:hypothetical protein
MRATLALLLATAALPVAAQAQTALGLSGDRTLVTIDLATGAASGTVEAAVEGRLLGIDLRPGTGQLIGVTDAQGIVEIDPATGAVTEVSTLSTPLPLTDGQAVVVDFNPMADRLRLMTGTTNHRVDVDTGEVTVDGSLAFEPGDAGEAAGPAVAAAAYINSYGKPEETAMYDIDASGSLLQQTSPNDGTLATIGSLGTVPAGAVAFDVATTAEGENTAYLVAGGRLHVLDLATGTPDAGIEITGAAEEIRDLAVMPAM